VAHSTSKTRLQDALDGEKSQELVSSGMLIRRAHGNEGAGTFV
jgi:hypothetical protein